MRPKVSVSRRFIAAVTGLFLFFAVPASAQTPELINNTSFRTDARAAVDSIYNFNFDGADRALAQWKNRYPKHPLWTLLDGMKFWWHVLSDLQDTSRDEQFFTKMKKADYEARKLLHKQPSHADGLIIRAISNGYMARQCANREEWVTSLSYARKALKAYEYLLELEPNLPDLKLAEGLKLYYSAYLPEAYPIVKTVSWFLPEGDKQKGLDLIRQAAEEAIFARAEATYFLGNINYHYEEQYQVALRNFEQLHRWYPDNNYYVRVLAKIYYERHRYEQALSLIDNTLAHWQQEDLPFHSVLKEELLYWKGAILRRQSQPAEALISFKTSFEASSGLPNTANRSFYPRSGYWAGKILYDEGREQEARVYLSKVRKADTGDSYRRKAEKLLSKIADS